MYEFVRFYVCSFELQFLMPYEDSDNPNSIFYVFGVYYIYVAPRRLATICLGVSSLSRRGFLRSYATIRLADASRQHHILCAGSQRYRFSVKQSGLSEQGSEKRWKLTIKNKLQ